MATVTHYIRSHYNPDDREALERETGQDADSHSPDMGDGSVLVVDPEDEWRKEAARIPTHRPRRDPPQFVSATITFDDWSFAKTCSRRADRPSNNALGTNLSGWYRSLTSQKAAQTPSGSKDNSGPIPRTSFKHPENVPEPAPQTSDSRNKNNWFIMNAIQSEPAASTSSSAAPTLADILAREPPPLPSQEKYTPPVWLEIGPSNRGFGMLQRSGWNEGEALGPDVIRRKPVQDILPDEDIISLKAKGKIRSHQLPPNALTRTEMMEVKMEDFDDVSELRSVDVIDLTLSDSDGHESCPDSDDDSGKRSGQSALGETSPPSPDDRADEDVPSPYRRKALLTPIATVLKSDKLGIGLKAKTEGIYKASKKRVTHSAAAMAAHVKAAEESRMRRKRYGRGRRGFEKQHKREEENRKSMLAYLKGL